MYFSDYENCYRNGELIYVDSMKVVDFLKYVILKGKVVYGGGGIIFDIFILKDISIENEILNYVS